MSFRVHFDEKELHHAVLCLSYSFPTTDRSTLDPPLEPASQPRIRQNGEVRWQIRHGLNSTSQKRRDIVEHSMTSLNVM